MRKFLLFLTLFIFCASANVACAESLLSGSGNLTYITEKGSKNKKVFKKYYFSLDESSRVNLRFITHVDRYIGIKLMERESENPIDALHGRISIDENPVNRSVDLRAGNYTFIVYQERPSGNVDNTGKYRFEFTKENMAAKKESQRVVRHEQNVERSKNVENSAPVRNVVDEEGSSRINIGYAIGLASGVKGIITGEHKGLWILFALLMVIISPFL